MANVSRIRGFVPSKSLLGAPWQSLVRQYNADAAKAISISIGDAVTLDTDGNVIQAVSGGVILGVVVAIGSGQTQFTGADSSQGYFNADDLGQRSLPAATAGVVGVCPAEGVLYNVYDNSIDLDLKVGDTADIVVGAGNAVTGNSIMALTTNSNIDVKVVEYNTQPTNDRALVSAQYIVKFESTENSI